MACRVCGREPVIMIRKGTNLCNVICEKIENDDISIERAMDYLWSINTPTAMLHYQRIWQTREISNATHK